MKRVVVESPYQGDIERNIIYARRCLHDCLIKGEAPIASHLLFTQKGVLDDQVPEERELGISAGLAWVAVADTTVVYDDYGISSGMQTGIAEAERHSIPVEYRQIGKNED